MTGLWISLVVPFCGLLIFGALVFMMLRFEVEQPPIGEFFWLFVFFGGILQLILTEIYWESTAGAVIGTFVLVFIGPFFLIYHAWRIRKLKQKSLFHLSAFILCLTYPLLLVILGILFRA